MMDLLLYKVNLDSTIRSVSQLSSTSRVCASLASYERKPSFIRIPDALIAGSLFQLLEIKIVFVWPQPSDTSKI
jgi:hypothetical protein